MKRVVSLFVSVLVLTLVPARVYALSTTQRLIFDTGIDYYNSEEDICSASSGRIAPTGNSVYVIGDSLTVGMSDERIGVENTLSSQLKNGGWSPIINAHGCRPVWYPNAEQEVSAETGCANEASIVTSAFKEFEKDRELISGVGAVIIALGTNKPENDDALFKQKSLEYIDLLRGANPGLGNKIYWVNLYSRDSGLESRNTIISEVVAEKGIQLIDYRSVATNETTYPFQDSSQSQVHLSDTGYVNKAKFIGSALGASAGVSANPNPASSGGTYDPLSLGFPAFPNESEAAASLNSYLKENYPTSPWHTIDPNIGEWLFSEAKTRNINPLLIASIGKQENRFGDSDKLHVKKYYNYFGMVGSGPRPLEDGDSSSYKSFYSPAEGIRFFMDAVQRNTQGPDKGPNYVDVVNFYEYITVHQTGQIVYPGEPFDPEDKTGAVFSGGSWVKGRSAPDGNTADGYDPTMGVYVSWTTTDHPNDEYDGNIFNPGGYYKNSIELINSLLGLTLSTVPARGGSAGISAGCVSAGVNSSTGGSGLVDPSGYSFPLAPQTRAVGGISVGQQVATHHDGTPAYDLFSPINSANVYAITSGVVDYIDTNFKGVAGCTAMQLHADDTYYYAFLHMKEPVIAEGTRVVAGQLLGKIADSASFPEACRGSGSHLHIDRGCVINGEPQFAGHDECRDPDFIPFLSKLYEGLL